VTKNYSEEQILYQKKKKNGPFEKHRTLYQQNKSSKKDRPSDKHIKDFILRNTTNDYIRKAVDDVSLIKFRDSNKQSLIHLINQEYNMRVQNIQECETELQRLAGGKTDYFNFAFDLKNDDFSAEFLLWRVRKFKIECQNLLNIKKYVNETTKPKNKQKKQ
jgi:hypothetical protein